MSSESKKNQKFEESIKEEHGIKRLILPFTSFPEVGKVKEEYIYTGGEKIPFLKRHPVYVTIFLNEFSEFL